MTLQVEKFYGEALVGERLVDVSMARMVMRVEKDGRVWGHSEVLNLELWWEDGDLRFLDPVTGEGLLNQEEEQDGRLAAEARAETAEVHAYEERSERLAAETRAETAESRSLSWRPSCDACAASSGIHPISVGLPHVASSYAVRSLTCPPTSMQ